MTDQPLTWERGGGLHTQGSCRDPPTWPAGFYSSAPSLLGFQGLQPWVSLLRVDFGLPRSVCGGAQVARPSLSAPRSSRLDLQLCTWLSNNVSASPRATIGVACFPAGRAPHTVSSTGLTVAVLPTIRSEASSPQLFLQYPQRLLRLPQAVTGLVPVLNHISAPWMNLTASRAEPPHLG